MLCLQYALFFIKKKIEIKTKNFAPAAQRCQQYTTLHCARTHICKLT